MPITSIKCTQVRRSSREIRKIYHSLEGKAARILNSKGKFIKEAKIKPQNVIVFDNFIETTTSMLYNKTENVPHGELVTRIIQRSKTFNNYQCIDIHNTSKQLDFADAIKALIQRIDNGEKVNAISCCFARELTYEQLEEIIQQKLKNKSMFVQKKIIKESFDKFSKMNDKQLGDYFQNIIDDYTPEFLDDVKNFLKMNEEVKLFEQLKKKRCKNIHGSRK